MEESKSEQLRELFNQPDAADESPWLQKIGGRKFVICVIAMLLAAFAVPADNETKLSTLLWIAGIYTGGNVAQKAALNPKEKETVVKETVVKEVPPAQPV